MELIKNNISTEFGQIPHDWISTVWGEVYNGFSSGMTPYRGNPHYYTGNIRWITSGELRYNVITDTIEKITQEAVIDTNLKILPVGTFLMAITGLEAAGTRGSCAIVGAESTTNQSCMAIFGTKSAITEYLFYFYVKYGNKLAFKYCQGTKQQSYTARIVKILPIALPPTKEEQQAIATALSEIDHLISQLDKLIQKKKAMKQGAMQQLLKSPAQGGKRLPGFDGQWVETTWGDAIDGFTTGMTPFRGIPEYYTGDIPWITSGELNYNSIVDTKEKITEKAAVNTNLKILKPKTFLMAITGLEAAGTRGRCALVGVPATTNQSCMAFQSTPRLTTSYLFHYYRLFGNELAFKYNQGTKQQSYTGQIVRKIPIVIPPTLNEQNAIAQILSDMDKELDALEKKKSKYNRIKQGMMQELLTGKTRLI
jgi:type I restriction enzyme S subunit